LKYFARKKGVAVQHVDSPEGEKKIGHFKADGFVPGGLDGQNRDLVLEINGQDLFFVGII
jgi:hypothetical protein